MTALLFWVFATHLPFFVWRYWKTRAPRFAATSLTFALLALCYGVRLWAPEVAVAGVPLFWLLRVPAWMAAAAWLT